MNYLLHAGVMVTIIKMFIILFLLGRIENILSQNKSVGSAFNWVSKYILFLVTLKGERKVFSEGCKKGGYILRLPCFLWNLKQSYLSFFFY